METGETHFNSDGIRQMADDDAAQREAELEQQQRENDQRMEEHVKKQMAEVSIDLVETDTEDEADEDGSSNVMQTPQGQGKLPPQFLTSTPYAPITQPISDHEQTTEDNDEERFLHANTDSERMAILYEARGHEIVRLRNEIQKLQEENTGDNRKLSHAVALLKGENEQLRIKLEHSDEAFENISEECRNLRDDLEMMKSTMDKKDKMRSELIARAEDSEHLVQSLQTQLIDLQKKDTILKAREHHEAVVSSLKERHENEIRNFENENDRLKSVNKRLENDTELMRSKLNEVVQNNELIMMDKSERIEELSKKLTETQKRLNDALLASSNQDFLNNVGDPFKEICDLKSNYAALMQVKIDQERHIQDLSDELAVIKVELDEAQNKKSVSNQKELSKLQLEAKKRELEIERLRQQEKELSENNDLLMMEINKIKSQNNDTNKSEEKSNQKIVNDLKLQNSQKNLEIEHLYKQEQELIDHNNSLKNQLTLFKQELVELKSELSKKPETLNTSNQSNLRNSEIKELYRRENDLLKENNKLKEDLKSLSHQIMFISNREKEAIDKVELNSRQQINDLKDEVVRLSFELDVKKDEYQSQDKKVRNLIKEWEINTQQIKDNHGKDRMELEEVRTKYKDLKRKIRAYQKQRQKEREQYVDENARLRIAFENILLDYKTRMESAVETRDIEIENELNGLRRQFDYELYKSTSFNLPEESPSISLSAATNSGPNQGVGGTRKKVLEMDTSDEENTRPLSSLKTDSRSSSRAESRAERMAKIFAEATSGLKEQLKRPHETLHSSSPLMDHNKAAKKL